MAEKNWTKTGRFHYTLSFCNTICPITPAKLNQITLPSAPLFDCFILRNDSGEFSRLLRVFFAFGNKVQIRFWFWQIEV